MAPASMMQLGATQEFSTVACGETSASGEISGVSEKEASR